MARVTAIVTWHGLTERLLLDFEVVVKGFDEVIIVDDASEIEKVLSEVSLRNNWIYIRTNNNIGFSAANNLGYTKATGDIIVFLNSDIYAKEYGLKSAILSDVVAGGIYGPVGAKKIVNEDYIPYIEGWCIAATKEDWNKLVVDDGPWDAKAYPGPYWEDNDLSFRALNVDLDLILTDWMSKNLILHKGGQTFGALSNYGESFEKNRATFVSRVKEAKDRRTKLSVYKD